ncbi:hypothetical protein SPHV1_550018 [Novosphingobium sp. KN65.2]|nr:hypothetical protein SPHV1_550018 [Novosphingobium sp. KN65.2]
MHLRSTWSAAARRDEPSLTEMARSLVHCAVRQTSDASHLLSELRKLSHTVQLLRLTH